MSYIETDEYDDILYLMRVPAPQVETQLAAAGLAPRALVQTHDGRKGWVVTWTYDGFWNVMVEVVLFEPDRLRGQQQPGVEWYSPEQLTPVWSSRQAQEAS